jgi:hypothetical protein
MAARTFGSLPISCVTSAQLQALAEKDIEVGDIRDDGCTNPSLNTCERDANDLLSQYPLYDSTRGVYTTWGSIPLSWDFENIASDERWGSARYVDGQGYRVGDQVLVITNYGLLVTLYEAIADGPSPSGPFNPALWVEVCHITTSEPIGLPDIETLLTTYNYYGDSTAYVSGNIVLRDTGCGDHTCVYIANSNVPINTSPPAPAWNLLYCSPNGKVNTCVKQVVCGPGRTIIDLSSGDRDPICVPVESTTAVGPRFS